MGNETDASDDRRRLKARLRSRDRRIVQSISTVARDRGPTGASTYISKQRV